VISRAALKAVSRGADRKDIVTLEPEVMDLDGVELSPPASERLAPDDAASGPAASVPAGLTLREAVDHAQREYIAQALAAHDGNWAAAARALGLDASNLHKLAKRLGQK